MLAVDTSDLAPYIKSKKNIYNILANEGKFSKLILIILGQVFLPPFDECTMDFIREIISGNKGKIYTIIINCLVFY
jgi:hypothetical protein